VASRPGCARRSRNSGTAISIGVFFTLVIAGIASSLPTTLKAGLLHAGVPHAVAAKLAGLPPVSSMFGGAARDQPDPASA
jgi:hypothetical protein